MGAFFLALTAWLLPYVRHLITWLRAAPRLTDVTLEEALDDLARALEQEWAEEERLRRVNDPRPLPVGGNSSNPARSAAKRRRQASLTKSGAGYAPRKRHG
ncbi:hypothetical protein [Nonomuraea diastatica]|uniref:Uncharacterized protein n=1 Tax=Nonomuraea diastatica TaxID=1848329 RepID=A0A4R4WUC9_9ACTN|nr:hypothetical protein [Nonomuraea diastatica]TDD21251.1 hypothetical protein E1294_15525 [Nonomuraea diastatica]